MISLHDTVYLHFAAKSITWKKTISLTRFVFIAEAAMAAPAASILCAISLQQWVDLMEVTVEGAPISY